MMDEVQLTSRLLEKCAETVPTATCCGETKLNDNIINSFNLSLSLNADELTTTTDQVSISSSPTTDNDIGVYKPNQCQGNKIASEKDIESYFSDNQINVKNNHRKKSLADMGFPKYELSEWHKINQPKKTSVIDLIYNMITKYQKTNVQILVGSNTFNCHMIVLQCYSDFFMKFTNEQVVILPEEKVTPQAFVMVYDWMLAIEPKLKRKGILQVFNAATFLSIHDLIEQCWACFRDDALSEDRAFLLCLEARKFHNELIQKLMLQRIFKFFYTLVASKEFVELTLKEVIILLKSDSIGVYSESEALMAAVHWIQCNLPESEEHIHEVIGCIRFGLLTPCQLVELRRNSKLTKVQKIFGNKAVQSMIDEGLSYITTKYYYGNRKTEFLECLERLQLTEPKQRQWLRDRSWLHHGEMPQEYFVTYEIFTKYLEYVRGMGKNHWRSLEAFKRGSSWSHNGSHRMDMISCKDESTQAQSPRPFFKDNEQLNENIHNSQICDIKPSGVGSFTNINSNNNLLEFYKKDAETDTMENLFINKIINKNDDLWRNKKVFGKINNLDSINVANKRLLIFGGIDPYASDLIDGHGKNVLEFHFNKNEWENISAMPGSRHHHSVVFCKEKIYVIGGTRPGLKSQKPIITQTMWSFDPCKSQWSNENRLPFKRRDFALVGIENGFYVIGGEEDILSDPVPTTLFYNISSKSWEKKSNLNTCRSGLMVALVKQNLIWAAGGIVKQKNQHIIEITDSIEEYNVQLDVWQYIGHLRMPRCYGKFCCIKFSELFLIGGISNVESSHKFASLSSVDRFISATNQWQEVTKMSIARHGHDVLLLNRKIFIFGGISTSCTNGLATVECLATDNLSWIDGFAPLPMTLSGLSVITIDSQV